MSERTVAIVLAGGRSSRFGRDKLVELIDGRPMLDRAVDAVWVLTTEVVVVAAPAAAPALRAGVTIVHDERPFEGPLAGLAAGLAAVASYVEQVLVVGGDMPTLVPQVLRRLLVELGTHDAAVLADEEGPRPLPLAVRREPARAATERLLDGGERRLRALLDELDLAVVPSVDWRRDDPDATTLRDVDEPADLPRD